MQTILIFFFLSILVLKKKKICFFFSSYYYKISRFKESVIQGIYKYDSGPAEIYNRCIKKWVKGLCHTDMTK